MLARWRDLCHGFREARQCGKLGAAWGCEDMRGGLALARGKVFLRQCPQDDMGFLSGSLRTG